MSDESLRILVAADAPPNPDSGAAGTVFATNAALRSLGHHVEEIWAEDLPHRISHWNLHYLLELPPAYRKVIRQRTAAHEPDVIQISQPHAWLAAKDHRLRKRRGVFVNRSHGLESMADAALAMWHRRLQVPPNRFPQSWFSPHIQAALHRSINKVVQFSDGIIVPAEEIRDFLVQEHGANPAQVAVIHHGVPDEFIERPRPALTPERLKRILHVGQFSFIKGPRLMVEAVQDALAVDSDLMFTWVCGAEHHAEARSYFRTDFQNRVKMHGWVSQLALLELYDSHGLFVAHSIYEGAAKACTEAMARGLAVVSSAVGAMKDHVQGGGGASLVRVGDTENMASELSRLGNDLGASVVVGELAANYASSLRWTRCAKQSVAFYNDLCSS